MAYVSSNIFEGKEQSHENIYLQFSNTEHTSPCIALRAGFVTHWKAGESPRLRKSPH